jgi:hypothetical protein
MMRSTKIALLLAAIMCVCGGTAASASAAAEWWVSGTKLSEKLAGEAEGRKFAAGEEGIAKAITVLKPSILKAEKIKLTLECTKLEDKEGFLKAPNANGAASLEFKGCKATEPSGCKISGEVIATKPVSSEAKEAGGKDSILFKPKTGETFVEPIFEGTCGAGIEGPVPIKGKCTVEAPNGTEEKTKHVIVAACKEELSIGTNKAEFKGEFELGDSNGTPFSFHE